MANYQALTNRATNVANTPYQAYQGELVAPLSNQTQAGLGGINQYASAAQPGYQAAMAGTAAAATPVSPTAYSGTAMGQFMNPYTQSVVNATQAEFNNQNQQQAQQLNSSAIGAGAFGGDRAGIAQAALANQQQLAQAPTIAGLNQANYSQALGEFNTQQQTGLQAQEYNNQQLGAMANQFGTLAGQAQGYGLQGAQANLQAGMIPQQEQQAIDTALQNQYQTAQAYPFQTTGWLGNIIEGTGSLSGGTGSTTSPGPSTASQALGGATAGLGILGSLFNPTSGLLSGLSDVRAKEDIEPIGKTFDGQTIYRFRFRGDPRTQIGLIAQEAEKTHPHAVGEMQGLGGLKGIDLHAATEHAADRGHFSDGGLAVPGGPLFRPGFQGGGLSGLYQQAGAATTAAALADPYGFSADPFVDLSGPTAIANPNLQITNPLAGVASAEWGAESGYGSKLDKGSGSQNTVLQPISVAPYSGTINPAPNYTNPTASPQTSNAEASLAGLISRPGAGDIAPTAAGPSASSVQTAANNPLLANAARVQNTNALLSAGDVAGANAAALAAAPKVAGGGRIERQSGGYTPTNVTSAPSAPGPDAPAVAALVQAANRTQPPPRAAPLPQLQPISTLSDPRLGGGTQGEAQAAGADRGAVWQRGVYTPQPNPSPGEPSAITMARMRARMQAAQQGPQQQMMMMGAAGEQPGQGVMPSFADGGGVPGLPTSSIVPLPSAPTSGGTLAQSIASGIGTNNQLPTAAATGPTYIPVGHNMTDQGRGFGPSYDTTMELAPRPGIAPGSAAAYGVNTSSAPTDLQQRIATGQGATGAAGMADGGVPDQTKVNPRFTEVQFQPTQARNQPIYTALNLAPGKASTPPPTVAPAPEHPAVTIARHIRQSQPTVSPRATASVPADWPPLPPRRPQDPTPIYEPGDSGLPTDAAAPPAPAVLAPPPVGDIAPSGARFPLNTPVGPRLAPQVQGDIVPSPLSPRQSLQPKPDPLGWSVGVNPSPPILPQARGVTPTPNWGPRHAGGSPTGPIIPDSWVPPPMDTPIGDSLAPTPSYADGGRIARQAGGPLNLTSGLPFGMTAASPTTGPTGPTASSLAALGAGGGGAGATPDQLAMAGPMNSMGELLGMLGAPGYKQAYNAVQAGSQPNPTANAIATGQGKATMYRGGRLARAAGGQLGQSGFGNALDQAPQGSGIAGPAASGQEQGGFATATRAANFDNLYGAGRSGFADGGTSDAPYARTLGWVPAVTDQIRGKGPPNAPNAPEAPAAQSSSPTDLSKGLADFAKSMKGSGSSSSSGDGSSLDSSLSGDMSGAVGTPDFSNLADDTFDLGFARGGRLSRAAGGPPTPTDADFANLGDDFTGSDAPAPTASAEPSQGVGRGATSPADRAAFIRNYIQSAYPGKDPNVALGVAKAEGLNVGGLGASSVDVDPRTGQPFSFGDFQMNVHPGALGDQARKAGYDPTDPNAWQGVDKYAIDQMYGGKGYNLGPWKGDAYAANMLRTGQAGAVGPVGSAEQTGQEQQGGGGLQVPPPLSVGQFYHPSGQHQPPDRLGELFGAMTTAGFAMMAGTSPYAAVNIGQGGEAGMQYLQKQRELDRNWMLDQAKIDQMSAQERRADADVGLRVSQFNWEVQKYKSAFDMANAPESTGTGGGGAGAGAAAAAPVTPTTTPAPIALPKPGEPDVSGIFAGLPDDTFGAAKPGAAAATPAPGASTTPVGGPSAISAPVTPPAAAAPAGAAPTPAATPTPAAAPADTPQPTDAMPRLADDPMFKEGQADLARARNVALLNPAMAEGLRAQGNAKIAAATEQWKTAVAPLQKGQETAATAAADQRGEETKEVAGRADDLQNEVQNLEKIRGLLRVVPTSALTDNWAQTQAYFKSVGLNFGDPTAVQEFIKSTTKDMWNSLKEQKGAVRNKEMDAASKMNIDIGKTPAANAYLLAQQLGLARSELGYTRDYNNWDTATPATHSPNQFKTKWALEHPLQPFVDNEAKSITYRGMKPPGDAKNAVDGQLYDMGDGSFRRFNKARGMMGPPE
jgi:hypothetical protein